MDCSPIILAHEEPFSIGSVEVRPATREMLLDGRSAILEPRVMQVLIALSRARGQVVSKNDLIACCWDQRVVGDDAINRVISRLRRNAEEDARSAFRIETITKVGYRLRVEGDAGIDEAAKPGLNRRRILTGGAAVGTVALAGWAVSSRWGPGHQTRELISIARDAILEGTPDQVANAVGKLRQATDLEPRNADAWGLLSYAYQCQAKIQPSRVSDQTLKLAAAAADRALALDPDNADAEAARLMAVPLYGNWLNFQHASERLIARHPDNLFGNFLNGQLLYNVGRIRDTVDRLGKALEIEPSAPVPLMYRAYALDDLGRTGEAQALIERGYRLWPRQYGMWFIRLYIFAFGGRVAEALAMCDDPSAWPVGIPPDNQAMTRAQIAALGDRSEKTVREAVDRTMAMAGKGAGFAETAMVFFGTLGMADRFFDLADRYFFDPSFNAGGTRFSQEQRVYAPHRQRYTYFLWRRTLGQMWHDPRFAVLMRRVGLESYWRASGIEPDYRSA